MSFCPLPSLSGKSPPSASATRSRLPRFSYHKRLFGSHPRKCDRCLGLIARSLLKKMTRATWPPPLSDSNLRKFCSARPARTRAGTATPASTTALRTGTGAKHRLRLHRQQAFALQLLAGELARAAYGFRPFADPLLRGLFIVTAEAHLAG